ncbi:unnamed protein product [Darwinula stevensoni]|uniref:U4/U6 small nuclear ribonucleoprotein Prp31 n=1 Tax=Darwinula stevensoni TaxID=69355 RepID=A0A7R8ZYR7_9CRUS|nr:unnamed protein product [Darwinula stevensoni]CAG0881101.1 unnamed protein product [Darwinula stevensoni]
MSLADELLADLEDDAGEDEENEDVKQEDVDMEAAITPAAALLGTKFHVDKDQKEDVKVKTVDQVAKLWGSDQLQMIMAAMEECMANQRTAEQQMGPVEADPEYQLIVEANNLAVEIDNEILVIHKFVRDKYSKRFPELESLVVAPLEYMMTVKELGNDLEAAKNNEALPQFLTQATIMVVTVTASTTQGEQLTEKELEAIRQACVMAIELNDCKLKIYEYVESRMTFIAPNLSAVLGAATAAKVMGVAGGLTNLAKMPACNMLLLGAQKKNLSGFSQVTMLPHTGFIYYCPLVQEMPPDLRRKTARLVACKSILAARVDASHESTDGMIGRMFHEQIEKKKDKWQEPPPVKAVKPLPAPIDAPRKKRGGRRVRKMKERYAMTELRKQANRVTFGAIEEDAYQEDLGLSLGQMKKSQGGRIRAAQVDEKTKVRISKTLQKTLQRSQAIFGGSTTVKKPVAGTASSVAFTPLQGLEIVNPQAAEKPGDESTAKYFSNTASFFKISNS